MEDCNHENIETYKDEHNLTRYFCRDCNFIVRKNDYLVKQLQKENNKLSHQRDVFRNLLKELHENVCYNHSDPRAPYDPNKASAYLYKKVTTALRKELTTQTQPEEQTK